MNNIDFNQLRERAYKCACDHGFHELELSNEHFLMLVITELSEAVFPEGFSTLFRIYIKDSVEDELADAVIRLLDLAGLREVEIDFFPEEVDDTAEDFKDKSFTECIYHICRFITIHPRCGNSFTTINFGLNYLITSIF